MSSRIPPSLKWLIDKRARINGEILKTKKSVARAQSLLDELSKLEEKLAAVDVTLSLHEIEFDKSLISPIRSQYTRIKLPHGELTRSVLLCLRLRQSEGKAAGIFELTSFVEARHCDLTAEKYSRIALTKSIQKCLDRLYRKGLLIRHHDPKSNTGGIWSLKGP